ISCSTSNPADWRFRRHRAKKIHAAAWIFFFTQAARYSTIWVSSAGLVAINDLHNFLFNV
ncbi:hypothetical protein C0U44_30820, partial [Klebsiella pneumoniae]